MTKPTPEELDELTPMKRHGSSVTMPGWAWRIHTITMIFLLSIVLVGFGIAAWDYLNTRRIVNELDNERRETKMAAASALLDHQRRITDLENDSGDVMSAINTVRNDVAVIKQDIAIIKARMP